MDDGSTLNVHIDMGTLEKMGVSSFKGSSDFGNASNESYSYRLARVVGHKDLS